MNPLLDLMVRIGVDDQATKGVSSITNGIKNGLATAAKIGATALASVTAGVVALTKASVANYAEYEQLVGGVEAMFGGIDAGAEQINKVISTGETAWKNLTMSQNEYYQAFTSTYPLIKSSIDDENEAIDATNRMLSLESDLANTFGYSMENASNAVNWALKGSFNYIDNLNIGIKGTAEGFLEAAHQCGFMVDNVNELTSDQILSVLETYADKYGAMGRTAAEAGGTIQGSVKMLRSAWQNLVTGMADDTQDFGKLMDDFIVSVVGDGSEGNLGVVGNVIPRVEKVLNGVGQLVTGLAPQLSTLIPPMLENLLPAIATGVESLITGAAGAMPTLIRVIIEALPTVLSTGVQIIQALIQGLTQNLPMIYNMGMEMLTNLSNGLVSKVPEFLHEALPKIMEFTSKLRERAGDIIKAGVDMIASLLKGIIQAIPDLIAYVPTIVSNIANIINDNFPYILETGFKLLWELIKGIIKAIPDLIANLPKIITAIVDVIMAFDWLNLGSKIITGIGNGIKSMANGLKQFVTNGFSGAIEYIKNLPKEALQWGRDLIQGFIDGFKAKVESLISSVSNVASKIRSFLHFSEPDEGPLSDFHTYAPDMMKLFAKGITDNAGIVENALNRSLDFDISPSMSGPIVGGGAGQGYGIGSVTINIDGAKYSDENELADAIIDRLQHLTDMRGAVYA